MKPLESAIDLSDEDVLPLDLKRTGPKSILSRRNALPPEKGSDIWLYTLSDLLLLLVVFFVLLFGMSLRQAQPLPQQAASMSPPPPAEIFRDPTPVPAVPLQKSEPHRQETLESELSGLLSREREEEKIVIWRNADNVALTFPENIIFEPGQAVPKAHVQPILDKVASFVLDHPDLLVEVHGHTDDRPIHNKRYPSNWELSVDRATQVAKILIALGVGPAQVSVRGFGEYRSLLPNDSDENRLKNRRVEIQFLTPSSIPS